MKRYRKWHLTCGFSNDLGVLAQLPLLEEPSGKELLDNAGAAYTERRYMDEPPTAKELDHVLKALGKEPWEIARTGEDVAKDLGLSSLPRDRAKWIEVMVANPILIERPILVTDDGRAAVGRPTDALEPLL